MGTSSNFGNMLSMALASIVLPFLPLLPLQILLNNLLYDLSELRIPFRQRAAAGDREAAGLGHGRALRSVAIMGPLSSLFDFLTFGMLLCVFYALAGRVPNRLVRRVHRDADPWSSSSSARTASVARPSQSRCSRHVSAALAVAMALPFTPIGAWFGFAAPPRSCSPRSASSSLCLSCMRRTAEAAGGAHTPAMTPSVKASHWSGR